MSRFTLPVLRTPAAKYAAGTIVALCAAALYLLPNRMAGGAAVELPLTSLDRLVPFWPWTGWIYASVYVFLATAFASMRDLAVATRFLYACVFAQVVAAVVFLAFPTAYPRELFPLPYGAAASDIALVTFWRNLDAPANCFPSLHVSTAVLCLAAYETGPLRRFRYVALAATVLLVASTLTFKQHYLADLVGGGMLGLASYWLFFRWPRLQLAG